jgi:hypothetical protein
MARDTMPEQINKGRAAFTALRNLKCGISIGDFPGLVGVWGTQFWSHRPSDFMVLGFSSRAKSFFAATSFVSKYEGLRNFSLRSVSQAGSLR